jgi:hypothetical protein
MWTIGPATGLGADIDDSRAMGAGILDQCLQSP